MVLTRKPAQQTEFWIKATPEDVTHSSAVKILGLEVDKTLNWKYFLLDGPQVITKQAKHQTKLFEATKKICNYPSDENVCCPSIYNKEIGFHPTWSGNNCIGIPPQKDDPPPIYWRRWSSSVYLNWHNWLLQSYHTTFSQPTNQQYSPHIILRKINHNRTTRNNGPHMLGPKPAGIGLTLISKIPIQTQFLQKLPGSTPSP